MYSHVACDVMKERTLYLLKPSSLIWHLMPYLFLFISFLVIAFIIPSHFSNVPYFKTEKHVQFLYNAMFGVHRKPFFNRTIV